MYKVFINDKVICFTNNVENCDHFSHGLVLNFFSTKITPFLVDLLCNAEKIETVIVAIKEYEEAFKSFSSHFEMIKAAGGIVSNSQGKKLFIYRLDKWDLPKGKIEDHEEVEEAAIREVEEECGISNITVVKALDDTFHIYQLNDQFVLKQTHWFEMNTSYEGDLTPQLEEGITKVEWLENDMIRDKVLTNTYASLKGLLSTIVG